MQYCLKIPYISFNVSVISIQETRSVSIVFDKITDQDPDLASQVITDPVPA